MTTSEKQRRHQEELHKKLWQISCDLRGQMEPNEFKNYILGLVFFRFLSEQLLREISKGLKADEDAREAYTAIWEDPESREIIRSGFVNVYGYIIPPDDLFPAMVDRIKAGTFETSHLQIAIQHITTSSIGEESEADFANLFEDMDLNNSKLGNSVRVRSETIATIIRAVNELPFVYGDIDIDVLGDAYEYLIGKFAANAGSKAGEFFTPQQVSKLLAKIVTHGKSELRSVYDPTCGSGSLLLRVAREAKVGQFYGQELTATTYNLARMNMMLHEVGFRNFNIQNGNTLTDPKHLGMKFSAIVANPPYSAKWDASPARLSDPRFGATGKLAPKSKADFAFIEHSLYHLDDDGTMVVVLPHGVLFRGAAEGVIRKHLVEDKNYLDAVIGLPEKLFYGTQIATTILVFKKCRKAQDDVLFIDASAEFERGKNHNALTDEHVEKIYETYAERRESPRYAHRASLDEIRENDFNLNIPRYVDTFVEEEPIDLDAVHARIRETDAKLAVLDTEIAGYFAELGWKA